MNSKKLGIILVLPLIILATFGVASAQETTQAYIDGIAEEIEVHVYLLEEIPPIGETMVAAGAVQVQGLPPDFWGALSLETFAPYMKGTFFKTGDGDFVLPIWNWQEHLLQGDLISGRITLGEPFHHSAVWADVDVQTHYVPELKLPFNIIPTITSNDIREGGIYSYEFTEVVSVVPPPFAMDVEIEIFGKILPSMISEETPVENFNMTFQGFAELMEWEIEVDGMVVQSFMIVRDQNGAIMGVWIEQGMQFSQAQTDSE